jgi:hypothetical protein
MLGKIAGEIGRGYAMKNNKRVLKIGIASREEIQARTLAIVRGR